MTLVQHKATKLLSKNDVAIQMSFVTILELRQSAHAVKSTISEIEYNQHSGSWQTSYDESATLVVKYISLQGSRLTLEV